MANVQFQGNGFAGFERPVCDTNSGEDPFLPMTRRRKRQRGWLRVQLPKEFEKARLPFPLQL